MLFKLSGLISLSVQYRKICLLIIVFGKKKCANLYKTNKVTKYVVKIGLFGLDKIFIFFNYLSSFFTMVLHTPLNYIYSRTNKESHKSAFSNHPSTRNNCLNQTIILVFICLSIVQSLEKVSNLYCPIFIFYYFNSVEVKFVWQISPPPPPL